jgi:hypothetical protein
MFPLLSLRALAAATVFSLLAACGISAPGETPAPPLPEQPTPGNPPTPPVVTDPGKPLSSYLRNLSPKLDGVSADDAVWEHYNIPVSDGTVLDGWVKRPPGE